MTDVNENLYPIQVARALMMLKSLSVTDIAQRNDIQQANVEAYLRGYTNAISIDSADMLFRSLGMDSNGLSTTKVHFLSMKIGRIKAKNMLMPLKTLLPLIGEHGAMTLGKKGGVTPVLIKSKQGHRIVIFVKAPIFHKVTPQELGLTPGSFEGSQNVESITDYYYQLLLDQNIKPQYFDIILRGTFKAESIDLLRIVALEYDTPLSEIIEMVIRDADEKKLATNEVVLQEKLQSNIFAIVDRKSSPDNDKAAA